MRDCWVSTDQQNAPEVSRVDPSPIVARMDAPGGRLVARRAGHPLPGLGLVCGRGVVGQLGHAAQGGRCATAGGHRLQSGATLQTLSEQSGGACGHAVAAVVAGVAGPAGRARGAPRLRSHALSRRCDHSVCGRRGAPPGPAAAVAGDAPAGSVAAAVAGGAGADAGRHRRGAAARHDGDAAGRPRVGRPRADRCRSCRRVPRRVATAGRHRRGDPGAPRGRPRAAPGRPADRPGATGRAVRRPSSTGLAGATGS